MPPPIRLYGSASRADAALDRVEGEGNFNEVLFRDHASSSSSNNPVCAGRGLPPSARQPHDLRPTLYKTIIRQSLRHTLLALADRVKPIASSRAVSAWLPSLPASSAAAGSPPASKTSRSGDAPLPRPSTACRSPGPNRRQFAWLEQPHLAMSGSQDARRHHADNGGVLGLGEHLGHAILALVETGLLEPGQRQRVSASKSPSCSASASSRVWLISDSASRTESGDPRRRAPWRNGCKPPCPDRWPPAPGPPARCCHAGMANATGSSALSAATNSQRVAVGASAARLRQTRTMLEARALSRSPASCL